MSKKIIIRNNRAGNVAFNHIQDGYDYSAEWEAKEEKEIAIELYNAIEADETFGRVLLASGDLEIVRGSTNSPFLTDEERADATAPGTVPEATTEESTESPATEPSSAEPTPTRRGKKKGDSATKQAESPDDSSTQFGS